MKFHILIFVVQLLSIIATIAQDSHRTGYELSFNNSLDDDSDSDDDADEDNTPRFASFAQYDRSRGSTWRQEDDRYHVNRYRDDDRYHAHRYRDGDRYHRNRHREGYRSRKRSHRKRRVYKSEMTLPSGIKKNITDPPKSKWECNHRRPKFIHLDASDYSTRTEYTMVKDEVVNTWRSVSGRAAPTITKIDKITNNCLWKRYRYRLRQVVTEATAADERLLFYGGGLATIEKVMNDGFDERTLDLTSTAYGAGFNFVEKSSVSDASTTVQADGSRKILMCRVILGKMATGAAAVAHPPVGSNSVKGGTAADPVYLIYRGEQAYPEYLITYT